MDKNLEKRIIKDYEPLPMPEKNFYDTLSDEDQKLYRRVYKKFRFATSFFTLAVMSGVFYWSSKVINEFVHPMRKLYYGPLAQFWRGLDEIDSAIDYMTISVPIAALLTTVLGIVGFKFGRIISEEQAEDVVKRNKQ